MKNKRELRKQILQKRDQLTIEQRQAWSQSIAERVIACEQYREADKILLFAAYKSEVDTGAIMRDAFQKGKEVYAPKIAYNEKMACDEMEFYRIDSEADLCDGYKGIREPKADFTHKFELSAATENNREKLQRTEGRNVMMILPGAVFDLEGNRIGYGGGFYDRYLHRLATKSEGTLLLTGDGYKETFCKLAVAFECQLVERGQIQAEEHDVKVSYIVTERGVYTIR